MAGFSLNLEIVKFSNNSTLEKCPTQLLILKVADLEVASKIPPLLPTAMEWVRCRYYLLASSPVTWSMSFVWPASKCRTERRVRMLFWMCLKMLSYGIRSLMTLMMLQVPCRRNAEMLSCQRRSKCKCLLLLFVRTSLLSLQWWQLDRNILSRAHENYPLFLCRQCMDAADTLLCWWPIRIQFHLQQIHNEILGSDNLTTNRKQRYSILESRKFLLKVRLLVLDVNVVGARVNYQYAGYSILFLSLTSHLAPLSMKICSWIRLSWMCLHSHGTLVHKTSNERLGCSRDNHY